MHTYPRLRLTPLFISFAALGHSALGTAQSDVAAARVTALEEVIVTSQKREQSLQDTPIAISVLDAEQLDILGITNLGALGGGAIPSLRIQPLGNTSTTLVAAIRGNGPTDISQVTRESAVAFYIDGIFMSRAQGLGLELADVERIEVLRGPQGTLFGRNATSGAVNVVSRKPSGEFGVKQTLTTGKYDEFRSVTRIDLPAVGGLSSKIDVLHAERDGWVKNSAPGVADFNEYDKDGARLSLSWQASDTLTLDYSYDYSNMQTAQGYFQAYVDNVGLLPPETRGRASRTRFPIAAFEPSDTDQQGHTLVASWDISESLTVKSLTGYRELDEDVNNNYGGVLYANGLMDTSVIDQEQLSQEFQLIGSADRFEWLAGLYYYEEDAAQVFTLFFSRDSDGGITGTPNTAIPVTDFGLPQRFVETDSESIAAYGQVTWTPPVPGDRLAVTFGLRYTEDEKSGERIEGGFSEFDLDTDSLDPTITFDYTFSDSLSAYVKWASAYKAGGVNARASFTPYEEEKSDAFEIGFKSQFADNRVRLNATLFWTDYKDMHIDFPNPANIALSETFNAEKTVEVDGAEIDLTVVPLEGLVVGLSYTYLDGDMPLQPNPLANDGTLSRFVVSQAPPHAGALTVDYTWEPWDIGTLTAHFNATSTDQYNYVSSGEPRLDGYTIMNARLTLADIRFGADSGAFKVSVWGRNLTDEEYVVNGFSVGGDPVDTVTQLFGDPRTGGIDVVYEF